MVHRLPWTQLKPTGALAETLREAWEAEWTPERRADRLTWLRLALLVGGGKGRIEVRRWASQVVDPTPVEEAALAEFREEFSAEAPEGGDSESLLGLVGWAVRRGPDGLHLQTYLPLEVRTAWNGTEVQLSMEMDPSDDKAVQLRVSPASPLTFTLFLKMPFWAHGCLITGLGSSAGEVDEATGLISLSRTWGAGDEVGLRFDADSGPMAH